MNNSNCHQCTPCLEADMKGLSPFQRAQQGLYCVGQQTVAQITNASPSKLEKLEELIKDRHRLCRKPARKYRRVTTSPDPEELVFCVACDKPLEGCGCSKA